MSVQQNPLKEIRLKLNLTIDAVGKRLDLSKQFIIKAEQGVYSEPSDVLLEYYSRLTDLDIVFVKESYYQFQKVTRESNYGRLIEPWAFKSDEHPFINWRVLSGIGSASLLCRLFCVHPAVLFKFEHQDHQLNNVPFQLNEALLSSGYSVRTLTELEHAYQAYKASKRNELEVIVNGD